MTVKELIENLTKLDETLEVCVAGPEEVIEAVGFLYIDSVSIEDGQVMLNCDEDEDEDLENESEEGEEDEEEEEGTT